VSERPGDPLECFYDGTGILFAKKMRVENMQQRI
jgi:hypothetical protein